MAEFSKCPCEFLNVRRKGTIISASSSACPGSTPYGLELALINEPAFIRFGGPQGHGDSLTVAARLLLRIPGFENAGSGRLRFATRANGTACLRSANFVQAMNKGFAADIQIGCSPGLVSAKLVERFQEEFLFNSFEIQA